MCPTPRRRARRRPDGHVSRPRPLLRWTGLLLGLTVLLAACSSGSDDGATRQELADLQAQVTALEEAAVERDEAMAALETTARQFERDDPVARLNATDAQLTELADALTVLEQELAIDRELRAETDAATSESLAGLRSTDQELLDALADVRGKVTSAEGRIDELAGDVDDLRTLYTTLRDRFDRLQRGS